MNGKYKIEFTPRFRRRCKALERDAQIRILREIKLLQDNPYLGKPLRGALNGLENRSRKGEETVFANACIEN
ncbi:hypothetical protein J7L70_07830 [Candidatus Bathyarchaeota archaeon]|nr:hypothetical protein [Candidatus Bathyarchaeota archaeon]